MLLNKCELFFKKKKKKKVNLQFHHFIQTMKFVITRILNDGRLNPFICQFLCNYQILHPNIA